jgi:NADH-ubiquinone oxidoreductase chain 5
MLIVVTFVSSLVHNYSISYMSKDPYSPQFMCYLFIFNFFYVNAGLRFTYFTLPFLFACQLGIATPLKLHNIHMFKIKEK